MSNASPHDLDFLNQLTAKIEEHLAEEQFGVSELADAMNMSRSNLLRKVKKATSLSVSQLINQVRLQRGMELLRTTSLNVSEVSHRVGFNSTSYFIKCFREYYGYPPGEAGKRSAEQTVPIAAPPIKQRPKYWIVTVLLVIAAVIFGWWVLTPKTQKEKSITEKSIVVLPFKNDSADSTNIYLINGLMEATLNNLQKIKDLNVLSRTSAEKYRNSNKTIPEIAKELNANYFVEGSGQKMGDRIVLTIQLIDGATDRHLWSKQYRREANDIFTLQQEIANDIAAEIQAVITPEEKTRIEKIPTTNMEAYDSFLKGLDLLNKNGDENLQQALIYFDEAIAHDNTFSLAYACAGIACYYLDVFRTEKEHVEKMGTYADKALLYDPKLGEGHTAKAMYYLIKKEYQQALPYLEKGLEYNPNSSLLIGLLADYYANYMPNTGKYLEYALRGMRLGAEGKDSVEVSYFYLRLGNALIQTGFVDESLHYIDKSLELSEHNMYSRYVRAFVMYAKTKDLNNTRNLLLAEFQKDTMRFDILQDLGKVSYYLNDFETAYQYYQRFNRMREAMKLDVYQHENMIIGVTYEKAGQKEAGKQFIESYREFLNHDQSAYRHAGLGMYYAYTGNKQKALEHFRQFAKEDNIQYWLILFIDKDPMLAGMATDPEMKKVLREIEKKFWANHNKLKLRLEEQGLL
ncbi:MAG: helix-turn-helix domain-containing protein [Cyclobacteriaceae bacterium]|nr:helix-turn-helix domain-containing protein [Cyclobacteriaceae bacterium]UYN86599.1 MAG: helix-turn-helix domain-containing protein [Cyclobacteriaceae bacterium]